MKRLILFIVILNNCPSSNAQTWQQAGYLNNTAESIFYDSVAQTVILGGKFWSSGTTILRGLATWKNNIFEPLGSGQSVCEDSLYCDELKTIFRYKNAVVISPVDSIGGILVPGIAKWDGVKWSSFGDGFQSGDHNGKIGAWLETDSLLYVGGVFTQSGNQPMNGVAVWKNGMWESVNFPSLNPLYPAFIGSLKYYKNEIYAAGNFQEMLDGQLNMDIARFDGASWHSVGGGLNGGLSDVWDMEVYKGELYVAGWFYETDGNAGNQIMKWNGLEWSAVGGGVCSYPGQIKDLLLVNDKLVAVGEFKCIGGQQTENRIAVWNGAYWCTIDSEFFPAPIRLLCVHDTLLAIGSFWDVGSQSINSFAYKVLSNDPLDCELLLSSQNVETEDFGQLQLSPNPASEALRLTLPAGFEHGQLTVFNPLGQPVFQQKLENLPEPACVIDIGGLPSGLYFAQLRRGDGQDIGASFIKQ